MKSNILLLALLALRTASIVSASPLKHNSKAPDDNVSELYKQLCNAVYKKNFKDTLTEYVLNEYKYLTIGERGKVQAVLEDLLLDVAEDFRMILNYNNNMEIENIVTRIGNPTFDEIHKYIVLEMPDIDKIRALRIAYALENNFACARQRIENVIEESKYAELLNSE